MEDNFNVHYVDSYTDCVHYRQSKEEILNWVLVTQLADSLSELSLSDSMAPSEVWWEKRHVG